MYKYRLIYSLIVKINKLINKLRTKFINLSVQEVCKSHSLVQDLEACARKETQRMESKAYDIGELRTQIEIELEGRK